MTARVLTLVALALAVPLWLAAGWVVAAIGLEDAGLVPQAVLAMAALGPLGRLLDRGDAGH